MKILIIDNNKTYLEFIKEYLNEYCDHIDTLCNPLAALECIKDNNYDLIICDVLISKMNGIELLEKIKRLNKNIKVIIHSDFNDLHFINLAKIKGIYNYYLKPAYYEIKKDISFLLRIKSAGII